MTESGPPIRVLLADDHAVVRKGIREFLETGGAIAIVAEAADGLEAIKLIREHQPDVAVLDIQMPGQSGIEVTRLLRAERFPIGILILTAFDDEPYIRAVLQAGANGYVLKTADAQEIVEAVQAVHEGKSALDPAIARKLMSQLTRPEATAASVEPLTERERDVLRLAAKGYTNKAIGAQLSISDRTVQGHLAKIYDKLHAASRTEAVMRGVTLGLIPSVLDEADQS
jgi:DNA-binding NarL/FixJ family response regulator